MILEVSMYKWHVNFCIIQYNTCTYTGTFNKAGDTPLSLACANGHLGVVMYLAITHHCDTKRKFKCANLLVIICVLVLILMPIIITERCMKYLEHG